MPALSQSLTFTIDSNDTVVLDYPNTGTTALVYSSNPIKGDGYFGSPDGLHTIQVNLTDFVGKFEMQGTLASNPTDEDWTSLSLSSSRYTLDTTGLFQEITSKYVEYTSAETSVKTYNVLGNFVWVRAKISNWTQGTVNNIKVNH